MKETIKVYKESHEGWLLDEKEQVPKDEDDTTTTCSPKEGTTSKDTMKENVARNVDFLQSQGTEWHDRIRKETGILTLTDLRAWAGRQMKLATECLTSFMEGYRQGRDEEVERMLNTEDYNVFGKELFEDDGNDEKDGSSKKQRGRRKPKRRVQTADWRLNCNRLLLFMWKQLDLVQAKLVSTRTWRRDVPVQ